MNILIVEDELLIAEILKEMLYDLGYLDISIAKNYDEAKQHLILNKMIDFAFLDINLTDLKSGIDVAKYIKEKHNIPFVYLTSNSDPKTVKTATATLPEAYLLKPFKKNELFTTLEIMNARFKLKPKEFVTIKEGNISIKISLNDLLFVKSDKNYLEVYTTSKRYITRDSLENFMIELNAANFMKVHRSFAVNIKKINEVTSKEIKIETHLIPLSRIFRKDILDLF